MKCISLKFITISKKFTLESQSSSTAQKKKKKNSKQAVSILHFWFPIEKQSLNGKMESQTSPKIYYIKITFFTE